MPEIIYPDLSYNVQGALYDVYNALRYQDLSESGWEKALMIALADRGVPAQQQAEYELRYKGYRIGRFFRGCRGGRQIAARVEGDRSPAPHRCRPGAYLPEGHRAEAWHPGQLRQERRGNPAHTQLHQPAISRAGANDTEALHSGFAVRGVDWRPRAILYEVHSELGPGFMHMHYRRATQIELRRHGIPYEVKKEITICFRGQPIETRETRLLIVDEKVLLAPIAVWRSRPCSRLGFVSIFKAWASESA